MCYKVWFLKTWGSIKAREEVDAGKWIMYSVSDLIGGSKSQELSRVIMVCESHEETHHLLEKMDMGRKNMLTKIIVNQDNMKNVLSSFQRIQDDEYQNLLIRKKKETLCSEESFEWFLARNRKRDSSTVIETNWCFKGIPWISYGDNIQRE